MLIFELELVEIGNDDAYAALEFLELAPADVRLHGGIRDAHDLHVALARKVIGRSTGPASEVQEAHSLLHRSEKDIVGFIRMREDRARKYARAVIVVLAAIEGEHIVVCAMFVIVLEKIVGLGGPLDKLTALKLVQQMADFACILRMRDEEIKDVMKEIVCGEHCDCDWYYLQLYLTKIQRSVRL